MTTKKQLAEVLGDVPLFSRCSKRSLKIIARHIEVVSFPAGTTIVSQGEKGETFFVVLAGRLAVNKDGARVGEIEPHAFFGELALLDPAPRSATVEALTDVELGALSVRMFRVLLRDLPQVSAVLLESMAAQLRRALDGRQPIEASADVP